MPSQAARATSTSVCNPPFQVLAATKGEEDGTGVKGLLGAWSRGGPREAREEEPDLGL